MQYLVLRSFIDPRDGGRLYRAGGSYPRPGYSPAPEHLRRLDGSEGRPALILSMDAQRDLIPQAAPAARKGRAKGG